MMLFMPIMSLVFCFTMPAAISVYWIAQAVFGMIQDYFLTKHYRKIYDAEDEEKRKHAAELARIEAEKEKRRALRREKNPDLAAWSSSRATSRLTARKISASSESDICSHASVCPCHSSATCVLWCSDCTLIFSSSYIAGKPPLNFQNRAAAASPLPGRGRQDTPPGPGRTPRR